MFTSSVEKLRAIKVMCDFAADIWMLDWSSVPMHHSSGVVQMKICNINFNLREVSINIWSSFFRPECSQTQ